MSEPKKKRTRIKDSHRWTEQQTKTLLQLVLEAVSKENVRYEQPTSQKFYGNHCQHALLNGIDWSTMKSKMRYLKSTYIKAINWREQVGSELFQSDKAHIEARMKTICPYYAQLNPIFEPMLSGDPIRLTEKDFSSFLPTKTLHGKNDSCNDTSDLDDSEHDSFQNDFDQITPKEEIEVDVDVDVDDPSLSFEESVVKSKGDQKKKKPIYRCNGASRVSRDAADSDEEEDPCYKTQFELECARLKFERKKFDLEVEYRQEKKAMSLLQLNFDRETLVFEKRKFFDEQRLRKYEIDKQFEAKKLAIEKDERLQRLELEYKYGFKSNNDSAVQYD